MTTRRHLLQTLAAGPLLLAGATARAQTAWPTRPVRLVVGFPGGSSPDVMARALSDGLARVLGDTFGGAGMPTLGHYLLLALPVRHIVTTNYDDLIERALTFEGR